jgi:hypothetical protein
MSLLQDVPRRKLYQHFDNPRCHAAWYVIDEMTKLRCKRVAHSPYSPDLTICDFYSFSRLKYKLAGFHVDDDDAEFLREMQGIFK